jgi:cell division protein FtsA
MLEHGYTYAGLDIGSHSIRLVVATQENDKLIIDHLDELRTSAVVNGEVIDIAKCTQDLKRLMGKTNIDSVNINISSPSVLGINCDGFATIKGKVVDEDDITHSITTSADWKNNQDKYCSFVPNCYKIDHGETTKIALNKPAKTLQTYYHLLTINKDVIESVQRALLDANIEISGKCIGLSACAQMLLSPEQQSQGAAVVDIGHNLIHLSVFNAGSLVLSKVLTFGGNIVENQIMLHYNCPHREAVRLKEEYGFIDNLVKDEEKLISFHDNNNEEKFLSSYDLSLVITRTYQQILQNIVNAIQEYDIQTKDLVAGVMLIGGGTQIKGLHPLAFEIFNTTVQIKKIDNNFLHIKDISPHPKLVNNGYRYMNALAAVLYQPNKHYLIKHEVEQNSGIFGRIRKSLKDKFD